MLQSLYIRNFVLIERLDITFGNAFSVITGETGSGKSIILGALALVLGQRADARAIKAGTDKCVIEANFNISAYQLEPFFAERDMEYDAETCLLRRELFSSGKSRAFVNDSPVSLADVKELGNRLIDIHSQHQNLLLSDNQFQLNVIDIIAGEKELLSSYKQEYRAYQSVKKQLDELTEKAAQAKKDEDYLLFQLEQLDQASLKAGEQTELEEELETLSHAEEIKSNLYKISGLLNGEDQNGIRYIREALATSESLERFFPRASGFRERLQSAYIDLNDLASEAEAFSGDIEFNPSRLEWLNERLDTIYSLQQKHHVSTVDELIVLQESYRTQLEQIASFDEEIKALEKQLQNQYSGLLDKASTLTKARKNAVGKFKTRLLELIMPLGMPNTRFRVDFIERKEPGDDGMDEIRFMFSANKSGDLERVSQIASGGEISRLMLCVKALIAGHTALPTIIFDEVDTGVSGDIADKMGDIMRGLGAKMQVISITHLPQIASKGDAHYYVYKEDEENQTVTRIRRLDKEERVTEIARMLSGATLTEASIANARDLLASSNN